MVKFIINDARKTKEKFVSDKLPSPQLIISSPPYFDLKDYGGIPSQIGLGQRYQEYLYDVISVFQQCYEISKKDASLWIIVDTFRKNGETIPLPFDLIEKMKNIYGGDAWRLRDIVMWHKIKNTPWHAEGRFRNHFEYILFFTKGDKFLFNIDSTRDTRNYKKWWLTYPERYNSNGKSLTNVWEYSTPIRGWGNSKQNHMCSLPFGLLESIIEVGSRKGDTVFDPFGGSGSAIALASSMGRNGIAFDINKEYKRLFNSEVMIAAKRYWTNREKEKAETVKAKKRFHLQNITLRKLKSTFLLLNIFGGKNKPKNIIMTSNTFSNKLIIILDRQDKNVDNLKGGIEIKKTKIEKTMKTQIEIKIFTSTGYQRKLKSRNKWFVYDFIKFYKINSQCDSSIVYNSRGVISNIFCSTVTIPHKKTGLAHRDSQK